MKPLFFIALLAPFAAWAADADYKIVISKHVFEPAELTIPSGKKIKLTVENKDDTPEEFDSHDLHREKIIPGKGMATINIGPLKPGRYKFEGEFHDKTAQGVIIAQ